MNCYQKYISKKGEIKTKEEWVNWMDKALKDVFRDLPERKVFKKPINIWEKTQKILKLEKLEEL